MTESGTYLPLIVVSCFLVLTKRDDVENDWFRLQFTDRSNKDEAIMNQWTFFVEHLGGPALFAEWRNAGGESLVSFTHGIYSLLRCPRK